ncbi:MAG: hypothetical protein JO112_18225, partial [Planctomycetes bacterium]|nr:hypothetical protein [Planctomycetota bacterium]
VGGQYSYESTLFVSNGTYSYGGLFMGQLWEAVGPFKKSISLGIAKPEDPLPISLLANGKDGHSGVDLYTEAEAKDDFQTKPAVTDKKEGDTQDTALPNQTPQLTGAEPAGEGAFNPDEALPPKLVIQPPPPPPGGVADPTLVMNILKEAGGLVGRKGAPPLKVESMPLFDAQVMTPYVKEGKETPLRKAVLQADQLLQELSDNFTEDFAGSQDNAEIKKQILAKQEVPAKALARLSEMQEELENLKDDRPNETKRWQANYDLVMARIEERFAYTYEYDYMLGLIRKAALPARDPAKYSGWRLAPQDKLQSGGEARKHQLEAKKILTKLMNQRKGTPWEVMARRESLNAVGLQWVLIPRE